MDELFSCISECQRLYPDSEDISSEEEESGENMETTEGDFYSTPEGLNGLSAAGESVLRHLESVLHINDNTQQNGLPTQPGNC